MSSVIGERLQELVNDYYHGLLTYESYRAQRGRFLDMLASGEFDEWEDETRQRKQTALAAEVEDEDDDSALTDEIEVLALPEPAPEPEPADDAGGLEPEVDSEPEPAIERSGGASRRGLWIGAGVAVVAAVAGSSIVLMSGSDVADVTPPPNATAPPPALTPGEALIDGFLSRNDWSAADTVDLADQWSSLGDGERQTVRSSMTYQRLNEALQQRLREEEALSGAAGSPELFALLEFAERMEFPFAARLRARLTPPDASSVAGGAVTEPAGAAAEPASAAVAEERPDSDSEPLAAAESPPAAAEQPPAAAEERPAGADQLRSTAEQRPAATPAPADAGGPPAADSATGPATASARDAGGAGTAPRPEAPVREEAPAEPAPRAGANPTQAVPATQAQANETAPGEASGAAVAAAGDGVQEDTCRAVLSSRVPYCRDTLAGGGMGPPLAAIRGGRFRMGSDSEDEESPTRMVTIEGAFAMSIFEISVGEFAAFCRATGRACAAPAWQGDDYPAANLSWDDAVAYADWLSSETGFRYSLPSEAQWEYAARAGTDTPYFFGDEITPSAAHSIVNGPLEMPAARSERAVNRNGFWLFHMAGNLREWVADAWHENYQNAPVDGSVWGGGDPGQRVVRGGSFTDAADRLRSAARQPLPRGERDPMTGFRVLREVEP